jgi:predicted extracellular nuclease
MSESSARGNVSIHDIQGCSHKSSYANLHVSEIKGIVTWKVENGFYMQEQNPDGKDCSSEGIFVFTNEYPEVIPGDLVEVDGQVNEFTPGNPEDGNLSVTEIELDSIQIIKAYVELPQPVVIGAGGRTPPQTVIDDDRMASFDIDTDGIDFYESLEGMRVQVNDVFVVESTNAYNEVFAIPTELAKDNLISQTGAIIQTETDANPERLLLQMPDGFGKLIRQGQRSQGPIIGVMGYEFGNYRILVTSNPEFTGTPDVQSESLDHLEKNEIRLVTYNINNFNRFDKGRLDDITAQIVNDLGLPDILVLQEVQDDSGLDDDGTTSASQNLTALVDNLNDESGVQYKYIDAAPYNNSSGGASGANIRTVILYREDRGLTYIGEYDRNLPNAIAYDNSRDPVVSQFSQNGKYFYVIGVHLVSNNLNTPLFGEIQPIDKPEEWKRIQQAEALANLVRQIQAKSPDAAIIVAGDFNDTAWSSTLGQFGSVDLSNIASLVDEAERYSILYEGNATLFDQILVSQTLVDQIDDTRILHINSPDPEDKQISDHDPVLIDIQF